METLKVLGQAVPTANVLTDLYTVPASSSAVISSIVVCNQNSSSTIAFRVSVAVGGAADTPKQYLYYDLPLTNNDTFVATIGISLAQNDVVRIQSDTANVSFNLVGVEVA